MIAFVVALDCEARPLIDHYRMRRHRDTRGFRIYSNDAGIWLVVTGVGRIAAAAGSGYLAGLMPAQAAIAWINVGVAGHIDAPLGSVHLVHKLRAIETAQAWYPPIVIDTNVPSQELITVDRPEREYSSDALYDMEGVGFFATACRFSNAELIQLVKIVSDNRSAPVNPSATRIKTYVQNQLDVVTLITDATADLADQLAHLKRSPPGLDECLARFHCSASQVQKLSDRLRRWDLIAETAKSKESAALDLSQFKSVNELLNWIEDRL